MPFHDAVEVNCKKCATTDIKVLVPIIWAKECMLDNYNSACVIFYYYVLDICYRLVRVFSRHAHTSVSSAGHQCHQHQRCHQVSNDQLFPQITSLVHYKIIWLSNSLIFKVN